MNATMAAKAVRPKNEMAVRHTDQLLRKHELLLKQAGNRWFLIDWLDKAEKPVGKERVSAYLTDLERNPGFPGPEVAAQLQELVRRGDKPCAAANGEGRTAGWGPEANAGEIASSRRAPQNPKAHPSACKVIQFPGGHKVGK